MPTSMPKHQQELSLTTIQILGSKEYFYVTEDNAVT